MNAQSIEQQVNLYQPILGAERRLFSAQAIGVALLVLAVCLCGLVLFGSWRTRRIERSVEQLAQLEAANLARTGRASATQRPAASLEELDTEARTLTADIETQQRSLEILERASEPTTTGFAARLEALAERQIDGIWLDTILVGSGVGRLSLRGAATDPRLLPRYLAALAEENALTGVRFDTLTMHRANPQQAPAQVVFDLNGPELPLPEHAR